MKDAYKFLQRVDALLEKEQGFKSDKRDSIICFGGNIEGSAGIVHGDARMLNAIIVNEMFKDETFAQIIVNAATSYKDVKDKINNKAKLPS